MSTSFNEFDHPRDEGGQFTAKEAADAEASLGGEDTVPRPTEDEVAREAFSPRTFTESSLGSPTMVDGRVVYTLSDHVSVSVDPDGYDGAEWTAMVDGEQSAPSTMAAALTAASEGYEATRLAQARARLERVRAERVWGPDRILMTQDEMDDEDLTVAEAALVPGVTMIPTPDGWVAYRRQRWETGNPPVRRTDIALPGVSWLRSAVEHPDEEWAQETEDHPAMTVSATSNPILTEVSTTSTSPGVPSYALLTASGQARYAEYPTGCGPQCVTLDASGQVVDMPIRVQDRAFVLSRRERAMVTREWQWDVASHRSPDWVQDPLAGA